MKAKPLIILFFALLFTVPMQAQYLRKGYLLGGMGLKSQGLAIRAGYIYHHIGGEVYVMTDTNKSKDLSKMEGKPHAFSIMGGLTYQPVGILLLTANVGYGSMGTYRVEATQTKYGVEGLKAGLEAGASATVMFDGGLSIWAGYTIMPNANSFVESFRELVLGLGFAL